MSQPLPQSDRIRPPMQVRSKKASENILEAGTWILENEGREALTILAVCARAGVAPTAIYRRVASSRACSGRSTTGAWRRSSRRIARIGSGAALPAGSRERVDRVVQAMGDTWESNVDFLHPIVNYSTSDAALRERGAQESLELIDLVAGLLPSPNGTANRDVARMLHQECVFRSMYGDQWLSHEPRATRNSSPG